MGLLKHRPSIKKTCDFCNRSAFGLTRRHYEGRTFCSAFCEAWFTNCQRGEAPKIVRPRGDKVAALHYP
jgi:hypothetical protein